jgi:aspartate kinase
VISAIAQATNMLERAGNLAAAGKVGEARDTLLKLFERHYTIVDTLVIDQQRNMELRKTIAASLSELEELVKGVAILHELTPRTLDTFYAYGELLSSRVVATALQEQGVEARWLDTKEFMITDETFNAAEPQMEIVEQRLYTIAQPLIEQGIVPVTQGFIGITTAGNRTTMGRESSDYSAAIIGAALQVDDIQIWTDVDGILTSDPRVVTSPKKVKALSFEEAFELSYFGAKVLHPNTMLPAIELNIPIHIYNSRRPDLSGSLVATRTTSTESIIKSIAYKRNIAFINISPKKRYSEYIFWEHIFSILTKHNIRTILSTTSEYNISLAVDATHALATVISELETIGIVEVLDGKGIICVVGQHLRESKDFMQRIFQSLAGYSITMTSFGASKWNFCLALDDDIVLDAVRKLHKEFFESDENQVSFEVLEHYQVH